MMGNAKLLQQMQAQMLKIQKELGEQTVEATAGGGAVKVIITGQQRVQAVTLDAARILGVDDRVGSIEPGKLADLVLYDGDPFEHATHVTYTIQEGRVVWDREDYLKLPFARRALPLTTGAGVGCCMGQW